MFSEKKMVKQSIAILILLLMIIAYSCDKDDSYDSNLEELVSLPYIDWTEKKIDASVSGVIKYKPEKSYSGYNFFYDQMDKAYVIDMYGKIIHTWNFAAGGGWEYGTILDNGDLISIGYLVSKLDWSSVYKWMPQIRGHHDVEQAPDGSYYMLSHDEISYNGYSCLFDTVLRISGSGEVLDKWSTYENLEKLREYYYPISMDLNHATRGDITSYTYFHTNAFRFLPENSLGKRDRRFQKGNWLLCLRNVNLIIILDKDSKEVVWTWGKDDLDWPHYPVMLENGEILIFDNGTHRNFSRVVQVNPLTDEITWEYKSDPPEDFYSNFEGSAQPLPNGNILVTEARNGRVFEITRKKEIVWDFYNFVIQSEQRHLIYRMIRYPCEMIDNIMEKHSKQNNIEKTPDTRVFNAGFEDEFKYQKTLPAYWNFDAYEVKNSKFLLEKKEARSGKKSVKIVSVQENDSQWFQIINLEPQTMYRLSGWIKTKDIPLDSTVPAAGASLVADLGKAGYFVTQDVKGTTDWTFCSIDFFSGNAIKVKIQLRLGFYGAITTGTAWFDDICVKKIGPPGETALSLLKE
ncbi:MAG: aryl-sulfate sulfotransferase [Spirochaetales bacterium]|nr:aryl-sulfate sulfotransferase [Spirochaetales bacterium]